MQSCEVGRGARVCVSTFRCRRAAVQCFCGEEKSIFITQLAAISQSWEIATRSCDKTWGACLRKRAPYRESKKEKQADCVQPEMVVDRLKIWEKKNRERTKKPGGFIYKMADSLKAG